jgi:hypothetical protein
MTVGQMKYRPLAHREPDGTIAVYVGGVVQLLPEDAAVRLRDQLNDALAQQSTEPA